jgi:DNA-binding XRE family transcriptional regulator
MMIRLAPRVIPREITIDANGNDAVSRRFIAPARRRVKYADLAPLAEALRECRKRLRVTQEEMGASLGISRKTYHLFETQRWFPDAREHAHFAKRLHELDPALAGVFADVNGEALEEYAIVKLAPGAAEAGLDPKQAKLVFEAAVYATAEELDMSPKAVRPIAAGVLTRLAESGISLAQAAALANALNGAATGKKAP